MKLLHSASIYTVVNVLDGLIPFLILPLLTRHFPTDDIGYYILYQAVLPVVTFILTLNTDSAVLLNYFKLNVNEFNSYFSNCILVFLTVYVILFFPVIFGSSFISSLVGLPYWALILTFQVVATRFFTTLKLNIWQVQKKPLQYGLFRITYTLLTYIVALTLIFYFKFSWEGIIYGQLFSGIIFSLISIIIFFKEKRFNFTLNSVYIKDLLNVGVPLSIHSAGVWFGNLASRFVINFLLGTAATGNYGVAATFGIIMLVLQDAFNKAYAPFLFEKLKNLTFETKQELVKYTYIYYVCIMFTATFISVFGYYTVGLIFGNEYDSIRYLIAPLVFANAFNGMYKMHINYVFFMKKTKLIAMITLFVGVINVIMCYFFINIFDLFGASLAFLFSQFICYILAYFYGNKTLKSLLILS